MTFLLIALALLILIIAMSEFFLCFALSSSFNNNRMLVEESGYEKSDELKKEEEEAKKFLASSEDVYIRGFDGTLLHAYLHKGGNSFLISLHGYKGNAMNNSVLYRHMAALGYSILVPDMRGYGKSGGKWIGMGGFESRDLISWIAYVKERCKDARIAIHGVSMGAATVMMAAGENPDGVIAAIEDCGYSDLYDEFSLQLKAMFHLPTRPILDIISLWCRIRLGFTFKSVSPASEVTKTHIPMLFIHGEADDFVPLWMCPRCYESHNGEKEVWIAEDARHAESMMRHRTEYQKRCSEFIERYMS